MYRIQLPPKWIDSAVLEEALATDIGPHHTEESAILVSVPARAAVMVDAGVRLLSLSNQLQSIGKRVTIEFSHDDHSTFGYLDRIGFFNELDKQIIVKPDRPRRSRSTLFHGTNEKVVEIVRLLPGKVDRGVPRRLEEALTSSIKNAARRKLVGAAAFDLFAELINNVEDHSRTGIAGYAVLQVYKNGVRIAVSDSGLGLLDTLKKSLPEHYPHLQHLQTRELLMHALEEGGLSCHGKGRGGGLKRCADHARVLEANLEIRTANHCLRVRGKHWAKRENRAQASAKLPLLWGTHVVFDFKLD